MRSLDMSPDVRVPNSDVKMKDHPDRMCPPGKTINGDGVLDDGEEAFRAIAYEVFTCEFDKKGTTGVVDHLRRGRTAADFGHWADVVCGKIDVRRIGSVFENRRRAVGLHVAATVNHPCTEISKRE